MSAVKNKDEVFIHEEIYRGYMIRMFQRHVTRWTLYKILRGSHHLQTCSFTPTHTVEEILIRARDNVLRIRSGEYARMWQTVREIEEERCG